MRRSNFPAQKSHINGSKDEIFQIRLRNTGDKIDLTDPGFLKMLELEYATKYLEKLKIEPTNKNIQNIIKRNPLSKCLIQQSRLSGGLQTDTITIIHKSKMEKQQQSDEQISPSQQMIRNIGLKKLRTDIFKKQTAQTKVKPKTALESQQQQDIKIDQTKFDFDIQKMKNKYIFPFNQSFLRKNNSQMRDKSQYNIENQGEKIIFQSKIFSFPFTQIKVSVASLKQLQNPIHLTASDIQNKLDMFCSQFPRSIFPIQNKIQSFTKPLTIKQKDVITFNEIEKIFSILRSDEMAKLLGVFMHFSYWSIFGNVNPINIESALKKQMYLTIFEIIQYFNMNYQNKRMWISLCMPMILLTIKMVSDYLFRELYPQFFMQNSFQLNPPGNIATDKILYLIQNMFDPSNLNGRFTFLQTSYNERHCISNDRKNVRKRIYGTSPMLNMIIPNPKNGKSRAIMAKKHQIQIQQGIFSQQPNLRGKSQPTDLLAKLHIDRKKQNMHIEKQCQQKMLNVVLSKLQSRIESKLGPNQIIKLGNSDSS